MNAIILSKGLHPPWNQGEVVLTKRFAELLNGIYDYVEIISVVDRVRGFEEHWSNVPKNVDVIYVNDAKELTEKLRLIEDKSLDAHISNISLLSVPRRVLLEARRVFVYQYSLKNVHALTTFPRAIALLGLSALTEKVNIITTSPVVYERARRLHAKTFYIPAPVEEVVMDVNLDKESRDGLNILFMGHADVVRFPVHKVLPAFIRLHREGVDYRFNIYLSKQGYKDYGGFYGHLKKLIGRYSLGGRVGIILKNLSEDEKKRVFQEADVFLYPALAEAAVDPPLTILEAMSNGLCVVATNVQSIPYILEGRGVVVNGVKLGLEIYRVLKRAFMEYDFTENYRLTAMSYVKSVHSKDAVLRVLTNVLKR